MLQEALEFVYALLGLAQAGIFVLWRFVQGTFSGMPVLEAARSIAIIFGAIAIPFVILRQTRKAEKNLATIDLIRTAMSAPEVIDRMEWLYHYRVFRDGDDGEKDSSSEHESQYNPYVPDQYSEIFDLVMVLNYFESVCYQITEKAVDKNR